MSEKLDLVRSICADWERGELSSAPWADPEIVFVLADGPSPGTFTGLAAMGRAWRDFEGGIEDLRTFADEYRELDGERVLVLTRFGARGAESGVDVETRARSCSTSVTGGSSASSATGPSSGHWRISVSRNSEFRRVCL
jgi:hypothetical protein